MSDDRWLEIHHDVNAAVRHFEMAAALYEQGGLDTASLEGYKSRMAFMHSMQLAYTCLENSLRRILVLAGEDLPTGESWHADLVHRCARVTDWRPAVLDADLAAVVEETRRFRDVATRMYDSFVARNASPAVEAAKVIARTFPLAIEQFRQKVDPDGSAPPPLSPSIPRGCQAGELTHKDYVAPAGEVAMPGGEDPDLMTGADAVLTRALLKAAALLGIEPGSLAETLGVSEATVGRFARGEEFLAAGSKAAEVAARVVSLYQALSSQVGDDAEQMRLWMASYNHALGAVPLEAVLSADGLLTTLNYLSQ